MMCQDGQAGLKCPKNIEIIQSMIFVSLALNAKKIQIGVNIMGRLEEIVGTEIVDDIRLGHTWEEFHILKDFILEEEPDWFIEVGIHEGGLSYLLLPELHHVGYIGIEIDCGIIRPAVKERFEYHPNSGLMCVDCFGSEVNLEISMMGGMKIIYCDGGNKSKELRYFKHFCRSGDVIMAHDFWDGYRKVKGVEEIHPEVTPMDVVHLDTDETFTRLNENIFKETRIVGWRKNDTKTSEEKEGERT
jgi:hypothetical protein